MYKQLLIKWTCLTSVYVPLHTSDTSIKVSLLCFCFFFFFRFILIFKMIPYDIKISRSIKIRLTLEELNPHRTNLLRLNRPRCYCSVSLHLFPTDWTYPQGCSSRKSELLLIAHFANSSPSLFGGLSFDCGCCNWDYVPLPFMLVS